MNGRYTRLRGLVLGGVFLALAGAFLAWHLSRPSDGARLEPGEPVWRPNGVVVTPLGEGKTPLLTGDVIIAVEGRSTQSWAEAIFQPESAHLSFTAGQPLTYTVLRDGQQIDLAISPVPYPLRAILEHNWSTILFTLFTQLVMTIVFLLRSQDRAARTLFVVACSLSHTYAWALGLQVGDITSGAGYWLYQLSASGAWLIFWGASLEFALVFPHPHPILQRRPWLVRVIYASSFLIFIIYLLVARVLSPTTLDWLGTWIVGNWLVAALFQVPALYFVFSGYRSTQDPAARKKVRWLIFAFALSGGIGLSLWFLPGIVLGKPLIDANALGLSLLPFPIILAIAVLHYQLFDIDVIIRRTLIYGALTALLALFYFGAVVLLQQLFHTLTGQGSDLALILSTLGIAALAVPLRNRVQEIIDRRFYRRKYDAAKVLAAFAATVRDEVDLNRLTEELQIVVEGTMQPEHLSLWLKSKEK